jgi:hypothetical protein
MEETSLLAKRSELKAIITEGIEKTFPAYFFHWIGRGLMKIFRLKKMPHWTVNALVLMILVYLPGILISVMNNEIFKWNSNHLLYAGIGVFAYLASITCHCNMTYNFLPGIRDHFVDFIQSMEELDQLQKWLGAFWSFGTWLAFMLIGGFLTGLLSIYGFNSATGESIGIGWIVLTFCVTPFFVISMYVIFYVISFPANFGGYHLELYESDPANSEVIHRLNRILNNYLYYVAGQAAIGTALASMVPILRVWVYYVVLIVWVPTALQFVANQSAIQKIIVNVKLQTLKRLQTQIRALQNSELGSAPDGTISRINQLMDLHDRIKAKPNSILNLSTGLSFLNQMMLPVLGWLLGNVDKLLEFINP